jgi:hypothetical protein
LGAGGPSTVKLIPAPSVPPDPLGQATSLRQHASCPRREQPKILVVRPGRAARVVASAGLRGAGGLRTERPWGEESAPSALVSIGVRTFGKEGESVFVAGLDSPEKLGHALPMRTTSALFPLGYRFRRGKWIVPHLSAGLAATSYKETSDVAGQPFNVDKTKAGADGRRRRSDRPRLAPLRRRGRLHDRAERDRRLPRLESLRRDGRWRPPCHPQGHPRVWDLMVRYIRRSHPAP